MKARPGVCRLFDPKSSINNFACHWQLILKVSPLQINFFLEVTDTEGSGTMASITVVVFTQEFEFIPIIVYVVEEVLVAAEIKKEGEFEKVPEPLVHEYEAAPIAVSVIGCEKQTVELLTVITGKENADNITVVTLVHELADVPITVYVPVVRLFVI